MNNIKIFSKRTDLLLFLIISMVILITSYKITVYHHVYVADIELLRINKNGESFNEQIGNIVKLFAFGGLKEKIFWRSIEDSIKNNMEIKFGNKMYDTGTKFIWIIRYSYNSTKKDKTRKYIFEADDKGKLRSKNP